MMGFRLIKLLGHALVTMIFCSSSYSILDGNDTNKEFVVVDFIEPHFGTNIKFGKKCDCILKSIPWWFLKVFVNHHQKALMIKPFFSNLAFDIDLCPRVNFLIKEFEIMIDLVIKVDLICKSCVRSEFV